MSNQSPEDQLEELFSEDVASVKKREKYSFDELTVPFNKAFVLFGAGNLGRKTLVGLRKLDIEPLAFADSNPVLWGKSIDALKVFSPEEAIKNFGQQAAFVVSIWSPGPERNYLYIRQRLIHYGCLKVVSFVSLYWKYPDIFLPHLRLDSPHKIYQDSDNILKAFALWADDHSRLEYVAQLKWLLSLMDFNNMPDPANQEIYLPEDLFALSSREVFVDCGAFDGDTIRSFIQHQKSSFDRIIGLEPDPKNYHKLKIYVSSLPRNIRERIVIRQLACGARREKVTFKALGTNVSKISTFGAILVNVRPLDEILSDCKSTYIKMDIEGAELDALIGARKAIEHTSPVLAVSVYHQQDHLWRLPLFIQSLSPEYCFFLRRYFDEFGDVVCYAVPVNRLLDLTALKDYLLTQRNPKAR